MARAFHFIFSKITKACLDINITLMNMDGNIIYKCHHSKIISVDEYAMGN
jgi:hypothetical protein